MVPVLATTAVETMAAVGAEIAVSGLSCYYSSVETVPVSAAIITAADVILDAK